MDGITAGRRSRTSAHTASYITSIGPLERARDLPEARLVQRGAFTAHCVGVHPDDAVEPNFARPALRVPRSGADVHPSATQPRLLGRVAIVVLGGELEAQQPRPVAADDEHRPVLA